MINIVVVDTSAEARNRATNQLAGFLRAPEGDDRGLVPRAAVKPLSPYELKFHAAPDVCVIGEGLASTDPGEVARIRKLFPESILLVRLSAGALGLNTIDQFARLGADDVISDEVSPGEFLRKLVIFARRRHKERTGTLVLIDGAKGGVGVTSIAASLAEALSLRGKKVAVVDLDIETQDLSRFLQTRPFVNENLRMLLDGERPISDECVLQCIVPICEEETGFFCMPPPPESDDLHESCAEHARAFMSILEVLDEKFDYVVVDLGCVRGSLRKAFYRLADKLVFVTNNDPASLFASVDKVARSRSLLSAGAELRVLLNAGTVEGITPATLREEFKRGAGLEDSEWLGVGVPLCKYGKRWPGSGGTLASLPKGSLAKVFEQLLVELGLAPAPQGRGFFSAFRRRSEPRSNIDQLKNVALSATPAPAQVNAPEVRPALPAPGEAHHSYNRSDAFPEDSGVPGSSGLPDVRSGSAIQAVTFRAFRHGGSSQVGAMKRGATFDSANNEGRLPDVDESAVPLNRGTPDNAHATASTQFTHASSDQIDEPLEGLVTKARLAS